MKFYKYNQFVGNYLNIIFNYKLNAIYFYDSGAVAFFKNGKAHSYKNAAYIGRDAYKEFWLNGNFYGDKYNFTKKSWRKFVKLQLFL
jgi:hypothetical protein